MLDHWHKTSMIIDTGQNLVAHKSWRKGKILQISQDDDEKNRKIPEATEKITKDIVTVNIWLRFALFCNFLQNELHETIEHFEQVGNCCAITADNVLAADMCQRCVQYVHWQCINHSLNVVNFILPGYRMLYHIWKRNT